MGRPCALPEMKYYPFFTDFATKITPFSRENADILVIKNTPFFSQTLTCDIMIGKCALVI
jgi:hypothetical protein